MKETAVLGKIIGIISNGNIIYIGSTFFLIETFGNLFLLIILRLMILIMMILLNLLKIFLNILMMKLKF